MKNNIKLRKIIRFILSILSTCLLIIMFSILFDCFKINKPIKEKIINYNIKDNIDYIVLLDDNKFFNSSSDKNEYYPPSLINKLQISFNYNLVGNKYFLSNYSYDVTAYLESKYNDKTIWDYNETIYNKKTNESIEKKQLLINDTIDIDIKHFYNLAKEFYDLTNNDVLLRINVNIKNSMDLKDYNKNIIDEQVLSVSLPISNNLLKIEKSPDTNTNKSELIEYQINNDFNPYIFTLTILIIISLIPVTVISYAALFNLVNIDDYNRKLKAIKNKYKHIIKEVIDEPKLNGKKIVELSSLNKVIDICKEKDLIINLYERRPNRECWFYVEDKKEVYLYIMTLDFDEIDLSDNSFVIIKSKNKK